MNEENDQILAKFSDEYAKRKGGAEFLFNQFIDEDNTHFDNIVEKLHTLDAEDCKNANNGSGFCWEINRMARFHRMTVKTQEYRTGC